MSNVPRQPLPHVAIACSSAITLPDASRIEIRNVASKTSAEPVTWAGLPIAAFHAGRSTQMSGSSETKSARPRPFAGSTPSTWTTTDLTDGNWVSV